MSASTDETPNKNKIKKNSRTWKNVEIDLSATVDETKKQDQIKSKIRKKLQNLKKI
ncbi:hypothetical protein [Mesomycoplasma ovipneumoniae]|uniref:hypothetical protein n=1 Tax=Mesomycoplasma ovipneumoniae TaxID=29562 RepID=UPI00311AE9CA